MNQRHPDTQQQFCPCASTGLIERYYDLIRSQAGRFATASDADDFEPSMQLPELDARMSEFLAAGRAEIVELGSYAGKQLRLLDLRQHAPTHTTKTFASLMIVARAIRHIQDTGEPILLFSPSSGNKAIALRDAVARALRIGLAEPEQLRIATLTPMQTVRKLRRSELSEDPRLRALNPVFVLDHPVAEQVKAVGQAFKQRYRQAGPRKLRLWHSLRLENYRFADQVRAFYDYEFGNAGQPQARVAQVHAVSSAYGLLGYHSGLEVLRDLGYEVARPAFLLVQHMATSDMVRHLLQGSFGKEIEPTYLLQPDGLRTQDSSPHFPARSWALDELLEPTFYTHQPATAEEMRSLIAAHGGSGIVVSLLECMERYAHCRQLLAGSQVRLPEDPRRLQEWSLSMALTGTLNAIDRGLLADVDSFTIHGSGSYAEGDYQPMPAHWLTPVTDEAQMFNRLFSEAPGI